MGLYSGRVYLFGAFLLLISLSSVFGDDNNEDDGVSVETVEEDQEYHSPELAPGKAHLAEHFDDIESYKKRWIKSEAKKQGVDDDIAKYDGQWHIRLPTRNIFKDDYALVLTSEAKHAAISTLLDKPFVFTDKPLVVQYEVTMQEGQTCGGAYIKLLSRGTNTKADLRKFHDQTPYTIMFGPDKCGNDNKLHFIFRHQNPKNGTIEEKHCKKPTSRLDEFYKDKEPHLYTLIVRPDNTFRILVDNKEVNSGSLLEDFTPPVNPPEEIDDPNDKKPDNWDEREKIVDPTAKKPEDWDEEAPAQITDPNAVKPDGWLDDEPEMIHDPEATKPEDWDDEMDGDWEAPLIDNPACKAAAGCGTWKPPSIPNPNYKGIWRAPLITNPNYQGKWTPKRIPNPDYFNDEHPFKMTPIHAVGFELWSISPMLLFDNLIVTDSEAVAQQWASMSFEPKRAKLSRDSQTVWGRILRATNYSPGWWGLYALYVAVPVSAYVLCLVKRLNEDSLLERVMTYVGENPWVYAVLIIGIFIIVGLVAYACCGPKSDSDVDPKKTDAVVEDDPHQSDGEEEEVSQESRPSKGDLEGPDTDSVESEPVTSTEQPRQDAGDADGQRKRKPRKE